MGYSMTGRAAHITAAASGGPRYDGTLSEAERKGADNGIWLCGTCSIEIDNDYIYYSVRLLKAWKRRAIHRARYRQAPLVEFDLLHDKLKLEAKDYEAEAWGDLSDRCSKFLLHTNSPRVFGRAMHEIFELMLSELVRNEMQHGGVDTVSVESKARQIIIRSSAPAFDYNSLAGTGSRTGGSIAMALKKAGFDGLVDVSSRHNGKVHTIYLSDFTKGAPARHPCVVRASRASEWSLRAVTGACRAVHIYSGTYAAMSDIRHMASAVEAALKTLPPEQVLAEKFIFHDIPADSLRGKNLHLINPKFVPGPPSQ